VKSNSQMSLSQASSFVVNGGNVVMQDNTNSTLDNSSLSVLLQSLTFANNHKCSVTGGGKFAVQGIASDCHMSN